MIEHEADVGSGRIGSTEILPKAATNLRLRMMERHVEDETAV
jgi:hypothetical protein